MPPSDRRANDPYASNPYPPDMYDENPPDWSAPTSRHGYVNPVPHDFPTQSRPFTGSRPYDDDIHQHPNRRDDYGDAAGWPDQRNATVRPEATPPPLVASSGGFDGGDRDYPAVLWWTVIWYAVPLVAYAIWAITLGGSPRSGCATVNGAACASARGDALGAVGHNALGFLLAILVSLCVAVLIRRWSLSWRAISVGFASAVVGSGVATVVMTI